MKCANCGALVDDGAKVCTECGAILVESVPEASDVNELMGPQDIDDSWEDEPWCVQKDEASQEAPEEEPEAEPEEEGPEAAPEEVVLEPVPEDGEPAPEEVVVAPAEEDSETEPTQVQDAFDPTPEPFVLLTSSAMNGIQQRCPHCGAVVYAGMRRCSNCGKRLSEQPAEDDGAALRAAPLHEYKRFIGNGGAILLILLVLAGGYVVARLVPRLIEPLFNDAPTISGETQSIDHEINAFMQESDEEEAQAEQEAQEEEAKLSPSTFGMAWHGTYQGTSGSEVVDRSIAIKFNTLKEDGYVDATCLIGGNDDGSGAIASYFLVGTINWETGDIELKGDSWINSGDLARMRMFKGTIDAGATTITGTSSELDGTNEGSWNMVRN